jgi:hypothetical protein
LVFEKDGRIGVLGTAEAGVFNQIGYNPLTKVAEQVVLEFDDVVTGGSFSFTNLFRGEGTSQGSLGDEQAKWEAFSEGKVVASGVFIATTSNAGTVEIKLPAGVTADKIAITPTEYSGGQNGAFKDSSDFYVASFAFNTVNPDGIGNIDSTAGNSVPLGIQFKQPLDSSISQVTISGVPAGSRLSSGIQNEDGSWTVPADDVALLSMRTPTSVAGDFVLKVELNAVSPYSPNLVVNGSFEDNTMSTKSWDVFQSLPGWKTASGEGIEIQENVAGAAADGIAKVELDSHDFGSDRLGTNSGMYQDVQTDSGQSYKLTFQYSARPGVAAASNGIEVLWNGKVVDTLFADGVGKTNTNWNTYSYTVNGDSDLGRIEFRAVGTEDSLGGYVDNVRLQATTTETAELAIHLDASKDPDNFIVNGSFEDLTGLTKTGFGFAGKVAEGWNLDAGPAFEVHNPRAGVDQAADGAYWLDMDASPGNVVISQQVVGLEDGKVYSLTFQTANSNPFVHNGRLLDTTTNGLDVYWNGEKVGEVRHEDAEFTLTSLDVRAGSGDGTNTLTFRGLGNADNVGISLDDIRMTSSDNLLVNGSFENLTGTVNQGWGHNAKAIQGWKLEESGTLIAQETFENGASGWTNNTTTDSGNSVLTEFLGKFGGSNGEQAVSKIFDMGGDHNFGVIEFDFLKLDSWDSNNAWGTNESLNIFINDQRMLDFIPEGNFSSVQRGLDGITGVNGNMRYVITSSGTDTAMMGASSAEWNERVYHVRIEIQNPGSEVKLGFGSTLNQSIGDESFGIDNVTIMGTENPNTTVAKDGTFTASGNAFEVHNPRSGVVASDGNFWLDMGGSASNVTISQQIPELSKGEHYKLSFDLADSIQDQTDGLDVIWNGEVIAHISGQDASMDRFEFELVGGSGDGSDTLKFRGTGDVDNFGVSLDNVSLQAGTVELVSAELATPKDQVIAGNVIDLDLVLDDQVVAAKSVAIIDGVPDGGKLSVGVRNEDGTWTVPADQLDQLTLRTPTTFSGQVSLSVEVHAVLETSPNLIVNGGFESAVEAIAIKNPDFQGRDLADGAWTTNGALGWTLMGPQAGGEWDPNYAYVGMSATEQIGYLNATDTNAPTGLGQTLDTGFDSGKRYELSIDIGNRSDNYGPGNYVVKLFAGDQVIGSIQGRVADVAKGTFKTVSFAANGASFDNLVADGTKLRIEIWNVGAATGQSGQVNFDNVRLLEMDNSQTTDNFSQTADGTVRGWGVFNNIDGWQSTKGAGIEVQEGAAGAAGEGNALVELDSHNNSGMFQEVATVEGQTYQISLQYSPRPGVAAASNGVEVYWNGQLIDTLTENGVGLSNTQWHTHTYSVEGNGAVGRIEFRAVGTQDSLGGYIDDVQMSRVSVATSSITVPVQESSDRANLVTNGSFENTGSVKLADNGWAGFKQLEGWKLESGQQLEVVDSGHRGVVATDGNNWLDLDASPGAVSLSQEILGMENGRVYDLSLDTINTIVNGQVPQDNGMEVFFGGQKVLEVKAGTQIVASHLVEIVAGSGDGSNKLEIRGIDSTPDGIGLAIDDVRVTPSSNLVVNGSFENLTGTIQTGWGHAAKVTQGWVLESGDQFEIVDSGHRGIQASDGEHWLDMAGSPSNLAISQKIAGVETGENYRLSFDLADSIHDTTDGIEVIWNGQVVARIDHQDASMTKFEMEVVGGSGDGSNVLRFRGTGDVNNVGVSLDTVRLELGDFDDDIDLGFDRANGEVYFSEGEMTLHSVGSTSNLAIAVSESIEASNHYEVQFEFAAASANWHNAFYAFDYESPENFKFAGARVGANYWTIGEYKDGVFRDLVRLPENILEDTAMDVKIEVNDGRVKLTVDGVEKARYDFGFGFDSASVGLVSQNSQTTIRDFALTDLEQKSENPVGDDSLQIINLDREMY